MSADNQTPDLASLLYGNLDKDPAAFAASIAPAAKPVANANLLPDPDDNAGHDPADPVAAAEAAEAAKDAGNEYALEPDSAVTPPDPAATAQPEPGKPAEGEPTAGEPAAQPEPAQEPQDLTPVFSQALEDYNATAQAAQEAAATLAELQNNAEGIVEFTPEMAAAMEAKMKAEAAAERAFEEIGDEAIEIAIQNYPELADDNHPATIAIKNILTADPGLAGRSPTAVAELSVKIAADIRAKTKVSTPPVPVSQPKPAPGPVPAKAPAPSSAMASHAQAQRPAPGQPTTPDIVAQVRQAAQSGSLSGLFGQVLGAGNPVGIRMS